MPVLKNGRHEAFAQNLAQGMVLNDAYKAAGYKENDSNASRLGQHAAVKARVAFLKSQAAERVVTTVEDIVRQLDQDRDMAQENNQASAMVQATMGKAKVLGLIVDKHLVGMKRVEDMNEHELRALLGAAGEKAGGGGP